MRSLIDTTDLSKEELYDLMNTALDISKHPGKYKSKCKGKKLATLFYEPSTRTRLSFEAAMMELGGNVLGFSEASSCSAAKGESISDTTKVVSRYADIIAMRSPVEGAAYVGAKNALVPLINAGDGGHCHPTQTLADLLTIYREKGSFDHLTIGFCGDLKYGRTVHSLINALTRYVDIHIVLISPKELALPEYMKKNVLEYNHIEYVETTSLEESIANLDILYMTRIQKERFDDADEYERLKDSYVLNIEKMTLAKDDMCVLHPLPRVNEISVKVDDDPRACYFKQVENGKLMRMALILKLLDEAKKDPIKSQFLENNIEKNTCVCNNKKCVSKVEQECDQLSYINEFGKKCCVYCDQEILMIE